MIEEKLYDRRIVARNIKRGRISAKEYEQFLKGLEDVKDKCVPMSGEEESEQEVNETE